VNLLFELAAFQKPKAHNEAHTNGERKGGENLLGSRASLPLHKFISPQNISPNSFHNRQ
jgi:hypothetical protein